MSWKVQKVPFHATVPLRGEVPVRRQEMGLLYINETGMPHERGKYDSK
jgi:hypothetical protein